MTLATPDFKTDTFFSLKDNWIETSPAEITHYFDEGNGIPLMMLHGSGFAASASLNWWLNIPELSESVRTIAFDLIGFGETICSPQIPIESRFGIKQWGEHTLRLMDALNIDKCWIMGSSLGGWVALQLTIDYPERFYGVISIGTGGSKRHNAQTSNSKSTSKSKPTLSPTFIRQDLLKNIKNKDVISDTLVKLRYQAALKEAAKNVRSYLIKARDRDRFALSFKYDVLNQINLPVLLIHGKEDKVVPLSRTIKLVEAIPTADAYIFNHSGHWPHLGRSSEFNKLVKNFITSHHQNS